MALIHAPNREYTGLSAGVPFINGEGKTEDPYLIEWFKTHGYTVEEEEPAAVPEEGADSEENEPKTLPEWKPEEEPEEEKPKKKGGRKKGA